MILSFSSYSVLVKYNQDVRITTNDLVHLAHWSRMGQALCVFYTQRFYTQRAPDWRYLKTIELSPDDHQSVFCKPSLYRHSLPSLIFINPNYSST